MVAPLSLCVFRLFFHLRDFRFHGFDQLGELFLAFFTCLGIHVPRDAFAVNSRCESSLVQVVVYHRHATGATLAYLALVGLKFLLWRGFCGGGFTYALRKFGHLRVCTAAHAIHDMQVIGFGEAAALAVVQHACPIVVVCGNGRTERDSDLLKAKLIGKPFRICLYFNSEIASPMVFSSASRPYLSTSALFFSP